MGLALEVLLAPSLDVLVEPPPLVEGFPESPPELLLDVDEELESLVLDCPPVDGDSDFIAFFRDSDG